jgi:mxaJ protein
MKIGPLSFGAAALVGVALWLHGAAPAASVSTAARHAGEGASQAPQPAALRVCADPNNLPFSNNRLEGFENKLAGLLARELSAQVQYTWWAQRRGFIRNTIKAGLCDVVMGVPVGFEMTLVTRPYYRSSYVAVTRRDARPITSFDDPTLRTLRVGVQLVGDDGQNTPPAHALASRHIIGNVVGYTLYGDYLQPNPPARIVDAVAKGDIDVAFVWGPLAGYFAPQSLRVTPLDQAADGVQPLSFDIGVGVSRRNKPLRDAIDRVLDARRAEIDRLLASYHVPRAIRAAEAAHHD